MRNRIPVTISFSGSEPIINGMKDDREETFRRTINWWRQIAEKFKSVSYLVAVENYIEYMDLMMFL